MIRYAVQRIGPAHALGFGSVLGVVAGLMQTLVMAIGMLLFESGLSDGFGSLFGFNEIVPWSSLVLSGLKWMAFWSVICGLATWLAAIGFNMLARISGGLKLTLNLVDGNLPVASIAGSAYSASAPKDPTMQLLRPLPPAPIPAVANQALAFSPQPPRLVSQTMPGVSWQVQIPVTTIGSDRLNYIVLSQDGMVEAKHAEIRAENGAYVVYDLESVNGVYVNNRRIQGRNLLKEGFQIKIGNTEMIFHQV